MYLNNMLNMMERITWRPGIGDPSLMGWVTVFSYFLTALFCFFVMRASPKKCRFWRVLTVLLLFLGINKQLDLQSLITNIGKIVVNDLGLYHLRFYIQLSFIFLVLFVALMIMRFFWGYLRSFSFKLFPAFIGVVFLCSFIIVRALSFHYFDFLIAETWMGFRVNVILELGSLIWIACSAVFFEKGA